MQVDRKSIRVCWHACLFSLGIVNTLIIKDQTIQHLNIGIAIIYKLKYNITYR